MTDEPDPPSQATLGAEPTGGRCPICKAPVAQKFRPFCSGTCADLDLLRWLRGGYVIMPSGPDADEDGDALAAAAPDNGKPIEPEY